MTYKQIEASREARLWIRQIVGLALLLGATTMAIPELHQAVAEKVNEVKQKIKK